MISVACYCRVSTEEQAREGYSITAQKDRLLAFCRAQEWIVADMYIDEGESGAKIDRPELSRLRSDAKDSKFNLVLAWKVDRLSRKVAHLAQLVEEFDSYGVAFRSVTEPFDTSHAAGRAFMQMLGVFAELERENIRERSRLGIRKRIQEGYIHGRPPMIGYTNVSPGVWEVEPEGAEIVKWIYEQYLSGRGAHRIGQDLRTGNIPGLPSQRVREEFGQSSFDAARARVSKILRNPVYAGLSNYNDELYQGRHEPVISLKDWRKVNRLMDTRRPFPNRSQTSEYVLASRIYCGNCGASMFGAKQPNPNSTRNTRPYYSFYRCPNNSQRPKEVPEKCCNWGVRTDSVDDRALDAIRNLALNPKNVSIPEQDRELQDRRKSIMSSLNRIERSQRKWFDAFEKSPGLEDVALDRIRTLGQHQRELTLELANLEKQIRQGGSPLDKEEVASYLKNVSQTLDHADHNQLREIVRTLVKKVIVTRTDTKHQGTYVRQIDVELYPL